MALTSTSFSKCSPSLSTNIKQCGTVTLCTADPVESDELATVFGGDSSNNYRITQVLFQQDLEIKMCGTVQNGLYDFLMANKMNLSHRIQSTKINSGLMQITPFVLAKQYDPINNNYYKFTGGQSSGDNWQVTVESTDSIPFDVRSFQAGDVVYITGLTAGGTSVRTAYTIVSAVAASGNTGTLVLDPQNSASNLPATRTENVTTGLLIRGTNNISDYEEYCKEAAVFSNHKLVPFWIQTSRNSMCKSDTYDKWRKLLLADNPLYREFGDVDEIEKNKQLGADWQRRWVNAVFWNKPLPNQTLAGYNSLAQISTPTNSNLDATEEAECIGRRANAVGVYEQLAECGRIDDLQGAQLNMNILFNSFYNIMRVREANGSASAHSIDVFTDTITAEKINQAMVSYYKDKSQDTLRMNVDIDKPASEAKFGFRYRSYPLFYPQGVTFNVVTHHFFDDALTAAAAAGVTAAERRLWVLDFSGIYPGILAANRVVHRTGDLKKLAEIDNSFACVMKTNTKQQTLNSVTWTVVVECPKSSLVIENFASTVPAITASTSTYPIDGTTETTTTAS
jgi:hypothetical protein